MITDDRHIAPFPLEGGRAGDGGGGRLPPVQALKRPASSSVAVQEPATTPPNPPHGGEGFDRFDRDRAAPRVVRRARRLRSNPTQSEATLWKRLRQFAVRFRRQAPIGPYVVDFACHRARLVIEVDGGVHALPEVALRDATRDEWLRGQGYQVLRFSTKQLEDDIEGVLTAIRNASPLPLDGEGVGGWGGGTLGPVNAPRTPASSSLALEQPATTPPNPPRRGEGIEECSIRYDAQLGRAALGGAPDHSVRNDRL